MRSTGCPAIGKLSLLEKRFRMLSELAGLHSREKLDKLGLFTLERRRLMEVYKITRNRDKVNAHNLSPQ